MSKRKEIAKFLSGVMAWEAISHAYVLLNELLTRSSSMTIGGITLTPIISITVITVSGLVSFFLAYYAWIRK